MIDLDAIRKLEEISPAGEDLVGDLIRVFSEETPKILADMKRSLATGDLVGLKRKAHLLKSSCANLGATTMHQLSEKIELSTPAGDRDLLQNLTDSLERDFQVALQELRRIH
jgi:HPt (histidine-containing phosphotransfer) domain-containing protein